MKQNTTCDGQTFYLQGIHSLIEHKRFSFALLSKPMKRYNWKVWAEAARVCGWNSSGSEISLRAHPPPHAANELPPLPRRGRFEILISHVLDAPAEERAQLDHNSDREIYRRQLSLLVGARERRKFLGMVSDSLHLRAHRKPAKFSIQVRISTGNTCVTTIKL